MYVRKNARDLTEPEKTKFVAAILQLKRQGIYDRFVQWHVDAMSRLSTIPNRPNDPGRETRNAAHRGPVFLPWHRYFLLLFERELQKIDQSIILPYWNWTEDIDDPKASPVLDSAFMGGDGNPADGFIVKTGPFTPANGWTLTVDTEEGGTALRRRLGILEWINPQSGQRGTARLTLPSRQDVDACFILQTYDADPWDDANTTVTFRNRLEGWTWTGMSQPRSPQLHNRVHVFIGGAWIAQTASGESATVSGTMQQGSSPNDPVFFLHHCYIDKIWDDWARFMAKNHPQDVARYAPIVNGPTGHNLGDQMFPLTIDVIPGGFLSAEVLGYSYDKIYEPGPAPLAAPQPPKDSGDPLPVGIIKSHFLPGKHAHGHHQ